MEHDEILDTINAYLEGYDPEFPSLDAAPPQPSKPPQYQPTAIRKEIPTVGCIVQRSDAQNARKNAWLLEAPPPPPPPKKKPAETPPRPSLQPARVMGPLPPPPIPVEVEPGHIVDVPHYSAHVARQYKARSGGARWHIRFNACGSVRTVRKIPART